MLSVLQTVTSVDTVSNMDTVNSVGMATSVGKPLVMTNNSSLSLPTCPLPRPTDSLTNTQIM